MKRNKYRNRPTIVDGVRFDSAGEAKRWGELCLLQRAKMITGLDRQVTFKLGCNGVHICKYIADFVYDENGERVVEDFKGHVTPEFRLKAKLFQANFGFSIRISRGR
jgi:hypothetical protein